MPSSNPATTALSALDGEHHRLSTRRQLFGRTTAGIGAAALASLLGRDARGADGTDSAEAAGAPHFAPRARRVIYLFQSGGPSQLETLDHKPRLAELHGSELPDSIRRGQRITLMTANQTSFPCAASKLRFHRHGKCGRLVSEALPHIGSISDRIAVIKSMHTDAINHDPAITCINTGSQQLGKASLGSWLSYGIGSESDDLPAYLVLLSQGTGLPDGQPLFSRLWGNGFLPSQHQGVKLRNARDAVLYLNDPPGIDRAARRRFLDGLSTINRLRAEAFGDPEIDTRIAQYEMAFRMQSSVPELTDVSGEPDSTFELYGKSARKPGTFAANCLLARRMAERGVRCIQLFHRGWDQHGNLPGTLPLQCKDVDQASAALVRDLEQRGLLDETLVIWGGEFGRTVYCQGKLSRDKYGRDHHGRCFSMWMAGGGIRGGIEHGETDDYGYNIVSDPVSVNDLNATILHLMGIDHERLTYKHRGLDERLTGVEDANIVHELLT